MPYIAQLHQILFSQWIGHCFPVIPWVVVSLLNFISALYAYTAPSFLNCAEFFPRHNFVLIRAIVIGHVKCLVVLLVLSMREMIGPLVLVKLLLLLHGPCSHRVQTKVRWIWLQCFFVIRSPVRHHIFRKIVIDSEENCCISAVGHCADSQVSVLASKSHLSHWECTRMMNLLMEYNSGLCKCYLSKLHW